MKNLIKASMFLCIFLVLFHFVMGVLWFEKGALAQSFDEKKNTFDIVYIGGSNVFDYFNSPLAFDLYGYTTGMLSSASQALLFAKYMIKEIRKYQKPQLYIIDLYQVGADLEHYPKETDFRHAIDSMKFSKNRTDAIKTYLKYIDLEKSDPNSKSKNNILNYEYGFLLYHNSWKNLSKNNFIGVKEYYKGYFCEESTVQRNPQKPFHWDENLFHLDNIEDFPKENREILDDLMNYIKKEKLEVLFVISAKHFSAGRVMRINQAIKILEKNGFNVLNFNTMDDFSVNYKTEMFNASHVNAYGATKYTLYFAKYLHDHYKLKDHRKDKKYQSWKDEYVRFKNDFKELTNENFDDILKSYQKKEGM